MMRQFGITFSQVGQLAGLDRGLARRALLPEEVHRVSHGSVVRARASAEQLLRTFGWRGNSQRLWSEYDEPLKSPAEDEQHAA